MIYYLKWIILYVNFIKLQVNECNSNGEEECYTLHSVQILLIINTTYYIIFIIWYPLNHKKDGNNFIF